MDAGGSGSRGVVPEDIAHVVEQPGRGQQDGGRLLFAALHAFHEKFRVGVAVIPRRREPFVGGVWVLGNTLAHEGQLAQQILGVGVSIVCGPPQIFRRSRSVFWHIFAAEIFLSQPVGGVIVAVVNRAFQPIDALGRIVHVCIVGEIQLAEGILRRVQVLLGGAFQQLLRFGCVRYQQSAVTVRRADDVLRVGVAVLRKLLQLLCCLVTLCQRKALIVRHALQILTLVAHGVGADLFAVILHFLVLEGKSIHAKMLRLFDDGVLDLAELLLLRQRWAQTFLPLGIVILHLTLQLPPRLVARIHSGQPRHLVDDFVHQLFHWLWQIAVGFLATDLTELPRQIPDHLLCLWVDAGHFPHGLRQFQHGFSRFHHQFVSRFAFLLVDMEQFLTENLVGERGLDLPYPIFG